MHPTTLTAAVRRFPLLGRPRPACPSLPERIQEVTDIVHAARDEGANGLAEGAHALNKAALIASDCGLATLARELCWRHINVYRAAPKPLTVLEARYMIEPVLNLARLQIRASDGEQALRLLTAMYQAVTSNTDLVVDETTLPLADLIGTRQERHKLREWVWLHLLGEGIRTLTLAGRWDDAVAHAGAHRGVGLHLMEGRQATILAHCLNGDHAAARAALAESTPTQPWERQVGSCLQVMCADTDGTPTREDIATMIRYFVEQHPMPGYAAFRAQLGLTITTLTATTDAHTARRVHGQVADEAIQAGDGYAAREVLRYQDTQAVRLNDDQEQALTRLLISSGLGAGTLSEPYRQSLRNSTQVAIEILAASLRLNHERVG